MKRQNKRILSGIIVLTLTFGLALNTQAVTIDEAQKKADELETQKQATESEKSSLTQELDTVIEEMTKAKEDLDKKQDEIKTAEENLVQAKVDENAQYQSMKKRIKYMYESGNTQFFELLVESDNIGDFLNKADYISQISSYDREMLDSYQDIVDEVQEQEDALKVEYEELSDLQDELIEKQATVEATLSEKDLELQDLETQIGDNAEVLEDLIAQAEAEKQKQAAAASGSSYVAASSANVVSGSGQFCNPCPGGSISSGFGYRTYDNSFHKGLDLAAATGTPTYAGDSGTVIIAGWSNSAGNWVVIDHGNGFVTKYMHHSAICVSVGQYVERGQQIGYVGSTGDSSGPHLHFQVELNGTAVDPLLYL